MSCRVLVGIPARTGRAEDDEFRAFRKRFDTFVAALDAPSGHRRRLSQRYWTGRRARTALCASFRTRSENSAPDRAPSALALNSETSSQQHAAPMADHVLAMLVAARETTASLMTWCLIELALHPEIASALRGEARRIASMPTRLADREETPLLRSFVSEAGRLHSPNLLSVREVTQPVTLGGYHLPTGTRVAYSPAVTSHFDARTYPNPIEFQPDRFTDSKSDAAGLLTFGAGIHACPGRGLAESMTLALLAAVLHRGLPHLPAGAPTNAVYRPAKKPLPATAFALCPADRAAE